MPELPEVEYTARQLRAAIVGATIQDAQVFWERTVSHPQLPDFLAGVVERSILAVRRRGKNLIFDLSGDLLVTIHRRMTGNLLLLPPGWEIDTCLRERDLAAWNTRGPAFHRDAMSTDVGSDPVHLRYCRVCFNFADGRRLLYTDPRKFGRIELWSREREAEALAGLGMEPLDDEFTVERLKQSLSGRKGTMKQVLLDQQIIAGLGNIYADEALYYASIHPLRPAHSLSADEVRLLHEGIVSVLTLGIEHGGTSFSEYRDLWGEAGENYNYVRVYQQDGKPCARCGTLIERIVVGQRSTHYCPGCQKLSEA
ncbi:MAG TPA: bifunctional DNA-formamidopyrimidine glycosylase/DNA-(apurinic or apyrimidinic site) lyase [Ktedonobacteraceae bacterium]|nr:bifunctional DNA-formamidopyrimidine glycosylase/DNA-(apurinic or apyrimidinic site) lyase [Ktedonobacteraceae bacterium]